MMVCPLLYHCPFSFNLQLTLSQSTLLTPSTSLSYHTMGKYNSTPGHLTEGMRIALCQQKRRRPALTQGELKEWLWTMHDVCVTQATINLTLKRSDELLAMATDTMSHPRDLHYVPIRLCNTRRWSLRSNVGSLSSRTRST
jgi:hypothetical protein